MFPTQAEAASATTARPVYTGLDWTRSGTEQNAGCRAASQCTPICYVVESLDATRWVARQGFRDIPGRPNMEIGTFDARIVAITACERHDFRYWASTLEKNGDPPVFMGSPELVGDFVGNLAEHERDDLLDMLAGGFDLADGRGFADSASYFPAKKSGLKQERSGSYTATLSIAAVDLPLWLMQTAPGANLTVGAVEMSTSESDGWADRAAQALRRSFSLTSDSTFQSWLARKYDRWGLIASALNRTSDDVEAAATETLRRLIGCPSRRDLATNRDAVMRLEKIDREFYLDLSRGFSPPPRG